MGGTKVIDGARALLKERSLPDDLALRIIGRDSPREWADALAEVALSQEVLPSAGPVLRGIGRPGFAMVAVDLKNRPGDTPSERLCASLGLAPSNYSIAIAIDPAGFSGERTTK